jgi:hypothetical protein
MHGVGIARIGVLRGRDVIAEVRIREKVTLGIPKQNNLAKDGSRGLAPTFAATNKR